MNKRRTRPLAATIGNSTSMPPSLTQAHHRALPEQPNFYVLHRTYTGAKTSYRSFVSSRAMVLPAAPATRTPDPRRSPSSAASRCPAQHLPCPIPRLRHRPAPLTTPSPPSNRTPHRPSCSACSDEAADGLIPHSCTGPTAALSAAPRKRDRLPAHGASGQQIALVVQTRERPRSRPDQRPAPVALIDTSGAEPQLRRIDPTRISLENFSSAATSIALASKAEVDEHVTDRGWGADSPILLVRCCRAYCGRRTTESASTLLIHSGARSSDELGTTPCAVC